MKKFKNPFLWTLTAAWVIFVGLFAIPTAKQLETLFMPVVSNFSYTLVNKAPNGYIVDVQGVKLRECKFLRIEAAGLDYDGHQHQAVVDFLDTEGKNRPTLSRLTGAQQFGQWYLHPGFISYKFTAKHQCHLFWETTTPLGVYKP